MGCLIGCLFWGFFPANKLTYRKGKNISLLLGHFALNSGELKGSGEH